MLDLLPGLRVIPKMADTPVSPDEVRRVRRMTLWLGVPALLLAAALAAMPFVASRPRPAPDVTITLLNGTQPSVADLRGQVVLVSFWSTSCAPCMEEMPALVAFSERNGPRGVRTLAVAMKHDTADRVLAFTQRHRLPFEIALDTQGSVAQAFSRTEVTPTKFLIDREGRIVRTYVGSTPFGELQQRVDALLAG